MAKARSTCDVCHEIRPRDEMVNVGKTKASMSVGVGKKSRGTTRVHARQVNRWVCKDTCVPWTYKVGKFIKNVLTIVFVVGIAAFLYGAWRSGS
jgi:hypothetical protein